MPLGLNSYRPPMMGTTHMVSSGHYLAAAAGYRILEQGGNAIDAGVASGIAINVTLPNATNFGGVAPIIVYEAATDSVVTISGLGRWPKAASIDYFNRHAGGQIPLGVLRTVMPAAADAWLTALERYGTMSFEQVVTPALELAEQGHPLSRYVHAALPTAEESHEGTAAMWPTTRDIYMPGGKGPQAGELLVQKDLARTFRRLIEAERSSSHSGREAGVRAARDRFYKGDIAREMAAFSEEQGGLLTMQDLEDFSVKVEKPAVGSFREYSVFTCGPWCQGPVVAQTLQMLQSADLAAMGHNNVDYLHLVSQALNLAYSDREHYYGDPEHVEVPIGGLLSEGYTTARRNAIDMGSAFAEMPPPGDPWAHQGETRVAPELKAAVSGGGARLQDTSYTCAVDQWGNAFSATPSDPLAGSPIVPGLGIQMSSRGSQSWLDPAHPSSLQPWKRPRLTPNPAIAFKNGKLFMPFGTPGGDIQCTAMVQMFLNIVEFGMDPQEAIEQPRIAPWNFPNSFWPHTYRRGELSIEGRIPEATRSELSRRGHRLDVVNEWSPGMGGLSAIVVDQETGVLTAGADPRRPGYAMGR